MKKILSSSLLCLTFATQAADTTTPLALNKNLGEEQQYWITIGQDAVNDLSQVGAKEFLMPLAVAPQNSQAVSIAQISESQLSGLSRLMHDNHNRCGGYIVHDTLQSALTAQQQGLVTSNFVQSAFNEQTAVNALLPNLDKQNILDTITYLSTSFVNRFYTTSGGVAASNGLRNTWQGMVSGVSYANVSQFTHSAFAQKSVVLTITGSESPDEWVVIGGHLDSTIGSGTSENSVAPGADDDASGIATLTEVMRVFLQNGQPKRSIKFIAYAAEEVGLRGSKEIAETDAANGVDVVGVLQLDMTNYVGSNNDIVFMTDYTSADQNSYLTDILDEYLPQVNYSLSTCGYGCSDHASWTNNGYPASMPFETTMNTINPYIHSSNDTLANMDTSGEHALNFAKMALAYAIELTNADASEPPADSVLENGVSQSVSGATGSETDFTYVTPSDVDTASFSISGGSGDADIYVKFGSAATTSSYDCRPYKGGNSETCDFSSADAGTYYVMVQGYSSYSTTIVGSHTTSGGGGGTGGDSGTVTNISVGASSWNRNTVVVPSGASNLVMSISGGTGDADLYTRFGSAPTTSSYDCRPYKTGNSETCTVANPNAGTYHMSLRGYSAATGVTLSWSYE